LATIYERTESQEATDGMLTDQATRSGWKWFVAGIALGGALLYLTATRPISHQLAMLEGQVSTLEHSVNKLVGKRGFAAQANDLLARLTEQGERARAAAESLEDIQALQDGILRQRSLSTEAEAALTATRQSLLGIARLQKTIETDAAGLADARRALEGLGQLKSKALAAGHQVERAKEVADKWSGIQQRLTIAAGDLERARAASRDLVALKDQILCGGDAEQMGDASVTLDEMLKMRARLQGESADVAAANGSLDGLMRLKAIVLAASDRVDLAGEVAEAWSAIHQKLVDASADLEPARRASRELVMLKDDLLCGADPAEVRQAGETLGELTQLNERLRTEATQVASASQALDAIAQLAARMLMSGEQAERAKEVADIWSSIQQRLMGSSAGVEQARATGRQLVMLKDEILCGNGEEQLNEADEALSGLVVLRERLQAETSRVPEAKSSLDGLVALKDQILVRTADLADAVETLETLGDLKQQLVETVQSFDQVRHWLVETVLVEPAVERAASMLKPLAELNNLRRMNPTELRQAARSIADQRASRLANKPANIADSAAASNAADAGQRGAEQPASGNSTPAQLDAVDAD
jgi:hypothetical protein